MATRDANDPDRQLHALSRAIEVLGSHANDLAVAAAGSVYQRFVAQETKADALALRAMLLERCPHPYEQIDNLERDEGGQTSCELCGHRWKPGEPVIVRGEATDDDGHRCRALLEGDCEKRCALAPGHPAAVDHAFPPPPLAAAPSETQVVPCPAKNQQGEPCIFWAGHTERGLDDHLWGDSPTSQTDVLSYPPPGDDVEIDPHEIPF